MVLYGVENHYEMTGESEPVKLFKTHEEAMKYFLEKFDECAERITNYEYAKEIAKELGESVVFNDSEGPNADLEDFCTTRTQAKNNEQFYEFDGDNYDFYRIVRYEV